MPAEPEQEPNPIPEDTGGWLAPFKDRYLPAYLVVTADTGLVRFFDGPVRAYLSPSAGPATLALFRLLRSDLHAPLRQALLQVADTRLSASRRVALDTDELTILVEPLPRRRLPGAEDDQDPPLLLVAFHPHPVDGAPAAGLQVGEMPHATEGSLGEMHATIEELQYLNAELSDANERLKRANENFRTLLDSTRIGTMVLDRDLQIRSFTSNMTELFALRGLDVGRPITDLSSQLDYPALQSDVRQVLSGYRLVEREVQDTQADPRTFLLRMGPNRRADAEPVGVVLTFVDITDRKRAEEQIRFLAHHDQLTGLPNRAMFHAVVEQSLSHSEFMEAGAPAGAVNLLYLDLDRFKSVNDTFGHRVGDTLLQHVATRLLGCIPPGAFACRLGGDEFAVVRTGTVPAGSLSALAEAILVAIAAPMEIEGRGVQVGVSIGIASSAPGMDVDALTRAADIALYEAKVRGRGHHRHFQPKMEEEFQRRRLLEIDLREAVSRDELALVFQPIVRLSDLRIVGAEALVRWQHPRHGLLQPASFIPLAEESDLIVAIGDWVLQAACADAVRWPEPLCLSVNLSSAQFASLDLVDTVSEVLARTALPPQRLTLEVTETVLLQDNQRTQAVLGALRRHGISVAMDDFGTGYSSLSYIRNFAIQKIKIDQAFIRTIDTQVASSVIVKAIMTIGDGLGIGVCAEGVETEAQLAVLRQHGVREAQGFLLHRPMSSERFANLLASPQHLRTQVPTLGKLTR